MRWSRNLLISTSILTSWRNTTNVCQSSRLMARCISVARSMKSFSGGFYVERRSIVSAAGHVCQALGARPGQNAARTNDRSRSGGQCLPRVPENIALAIRRIPGSTTFSRGNVHHNCDFPHGTNAMRLRNFSAASVCLHRHNHQRGVCGRKPMETWDSASNTISLRLFARDTVAPF